MLQRFVQFTSVICAWVLCIASTEFTARADFAADQTILDSKSYSSRSANYVLQVHPSSRYGAGPANCELFQAGRLKWSIELPFTLWNACVSESGIVGGYGYSNGFEPWGDWGDFRVVVIGQDGAVRAVHSTKRINGYANQPPSPYARGVLLDSSNDRLIVRVADSDPNRELECWLTYSLSSGRLEQSFKPRDLSGDLKLRDMVGHRKVIVSAAAIGGTNLALLNWRCLVCDGCQSRSQFTLIDPLGRPQWKFELPGGGSILGASDVERRFDLLSQSTWQKIEFRVLCAPNGTPKVEEVRRSAVIKESNATPPVEILTYSPRVLGRIKLPLRSAPLDLSRGAAAIAETGVHRAKQREWYDSVQIDRQGNIHALHMPAATIDVFDSKGSLLRSSLSSDYDHLLQRGSVRFTLSAEGDEYYYRIGAEPGQTQAWLHVEAGGRRLIEKIPSSESMPSGLFCQPKTKNFWILGFHNVVLVNRSGQVLKKIDRCPDGRWMDRPGPASVAPDGSIAVVARGAINCFTPTGEPVRSMGLCAELADGSFEFVYDGERAVVAQYFDESHDEVFLIDKSGRCSKSRSLLLRGPGSTQIPMLSLDGSEMLHFDGIHTITRYSLPGGQAR